MQYVQHGGACCGISHVRDFDGATIADLDEIIRRHDTDNEHGTPGNRVLEAVLSERQISREATRPAGRLHVPDPIWEAGGWANILLRRGFRLVTRFNNSNSRNNCYIYHRVTRPLPLDDGLPFEVGTGAEPEAVTATAPVALEIPEDWADHPEDILEFHDGSRFRITAVNRNRIRPSLEGYILPAGRSLRLPCGHVINTSVRFAFYLDDGSWAGRRGQALRNIAAAVEPEAVAPAPAPVRRFTPELARRVTPGTILEYRSGVPGSSENFNGTWQVSRVLTNDFEVESHAAPRTGAGVVLLAFNRFIVPAGFNVLAVEEPEAPVETPEEPVDGQWVEATRENVAIGSRVRYVFGDSRGAVFARIGFEGVVTAVNERFPELSARTTNNHAVATLPSSRFVCFDVFVEEPVAAPAPAAEPEPEQEGQVDVIVSPRFYCVFRDGRRSTRSFDTREAAVARWPRCRNHVRVDTFDDGSTEEVNLEAL